MPTHCARVRNHGMLQLKTGAAMSYRLNWFKDGRLINTEISEQARLDLTKKRARGLVDEGSADRIEVCSANGLVVFGYPRTLRRH